MISMTPIHRHSTPARERHSSTPAAAPSMAAAATAGPRPVSRPHTTAAVTIAVQITDIAIPAPPFSPCIWDGLGENVKLFFAKKVKFSVN